MKRNLKKKLPNPKFNPRNSMDFIRNTGKDNNETIDSSVQQFSDSSSDDSIQIQRDLKRRRSSRSNLIKFNQNDFEGMAKPCCSKSPHQFASSTMNKSLTERLCDGFPNISPIAAKKDGGSSLIQAQKKIASDIDHRILTSSPHDQHARQLSRRPKASTGEKGEQCQLMNIEISSINSLVDSSLVHMHLLPMTRGTINSDEIAPKSSSEEKTNSGLDGGGSGESVGEASPVRDPQTNNNNSRKKLTGIKKKEEDGGVADVARSKRRSSTTMTRAAVVDRKSNALSSSTPVVAATSVTSVQTGTRASHHNCENEFASSPPPSCSSDVTLDPICFPCRKPKHTKKVAKNSKYKKFKVDFGPHSSEDDVPEDQLMFN